ncbi:hypothetical protein [Yersinia enterocolitica]
MRKIRYTGYQIIAVLKYIEARQTVNDVCRELVSPTLAPCSEEYGAVKSTSWWLKTQKSQSTWD